MNSSMQEIYTQLWNEHVQSIRNFCYSKLKGRPEDAEDMLQEAFGLLWKKMITEGLPPNPKAWLLSTVNNLARTEYRHTAKSKEKLSSAPFDETVVHTNYSAEDVVQTLEREEHNAKLWKAFDEGLTKEEKQIIIYDTVQEIPQAEIAKIINKNPNTTRVNIHRAKQKLEHIKQKIEKS